MNPNQEYASLRRYVDQPEPTFTKANVETWNKSRHAAPPRPYSVFDFPARLLRITEKCYFVLLAALGCALLFVAGEIFYAFVSGRVQQILDAAKASH